MPIAPRPLFRDPIYDGAADPVVVWNLQTKSWFMLYTNRRATLCQLPGVSWVHSTRIGIAESVDGAFWDYRGTATIRYGKPEDAHWAPDVVYAGGQYHMFLSHVPGVHTDWSGTRDVVHLTSKNLVEWNYHSTVPLKSDRVIDASVFQLPDGSWRLWYNDETDGKAIRYADSCDLSEWHDRAKIAIDEPGEGPKVFHFEGRYWLIVDHWKGLGVYHSEDATGWTRQPGYLLGQPGTGEDDGVMGQHADVLVNAGRAYIFYFTHPDNALDRKHLVDANPRRTSIQVTELFVRDGVLVCDRNQPTDINLKASAE